MPWKHCDVAFILDNEPCPDCGATKDSWTIEVDKTRVMQVARKRAFLELELLDAAGAPMADAEYCFTFSAGRQRKGKLDENGLAKVRNLAPGTCTAEFPEHGIKEPIELEAEFCKGKESKRYTYTAQPSADHWIEFTFKGADGDPLANEPYRVEFPEDEDLEPREGELDDSGHMRVEGLPAAGPCTVTFPKRFAPKNREPKCLEKDGQPA